MKIGTAFLISGWVYLIVGICAFFLKSIFASLFILFMAKVFFYVFFGIEIYRLYKWKRDVDYKLGKILSWLKTIPAK